MRERGSPLGTAGRGHGDSWEEGQRGAARGHGDSWGGEGGGRLCAGMAAGGTWG